METSENVSIPDRLPVFYLLDTIICPYTVIPLSIQAEESKAAFRHALMRDQLIVAVIKQETDPTGIGTLCRIAKQIGMPDGSVQVIVQGLERVRLGEVVQKEPFYISHITLCPDSETSDATITPLKETVTTQFLRLAPSIPHLPKGIIDALPSLETPRQTAYAITACLTITPAQMQRVLEADSVKEKLEIIIAYLAEEQVKWEAEAQEPTKDKAFKRFSRLPG
jgi:ATP-dependent Lon protease